MKHLSDNEIQDWLDGNLSRNKSEIREHLDYCRLCQTQLKEYTLLFGKLEKETIPELSPDFALSVLNRIAVETEPETEPTRSFLPLLLSLSGGLVTLLITVYFVDFTRMLKLFNLPGWGEYINSAFFSTAGELSGSLGIDLSLIIYSALILIVIAAVDYIVRHTGRRPISFLV